MEDNNECVEQKRHLRNSNNPIRNPLGAEDNLLIQGSHRHLLFTLNIASDIVSNYQEALARTQKQYCNCVLSNTGSPNSNSIQLSRAVESDAPDSNQNTKVMFVSTQADPEMINACLCVHSSCFLSKFAHVDAIKMPIFHREDFYAVF